jgi:hypothetical protein
MRIQFALNTLAIFVIGGALVSPLSAQWSSGSGGSIYYSGGNVGIGTASPVRALEVAGYTQIDSDLYFKKGSSSFIGSIDNTDLRLGTNFAERVRITAVGNVGIGTISPQYLLSVNGTIGTKDVIVTNTGWSDYVFRPGYRLRPLSEVNAYIQANHHLPDIPTEAEVKQKGVSVGEMQAKLLAKVEELTLHMIQREKENQELRERITRLETRAASSGAPAER